MKKLLFLFSILGFVNVAAQTKDVPDSLRQLVLAARYHSGFMFAHSIHVQNVKGAYPKGFEMEYSHIRTDTAAHLKFNCYPRIGFSFTYVDYNRDFLGRSYALSYFLEPNYKIGNKLKLSIRAGAGLAYFTNPYDSIKNPVNQSYSTYINSFLQLGFGLSYPLNKHLAIYSMASFFHNSNAGFKEPNAGMNYINASIGLQYYKHSTRFPTHKFTKDTAWKHKPVHIDVSFFYSPKSGYSSDSSIARKFLFGTSVSFVKQVSSIDAITAAAEVYYDDGLRSVKEVFIGDTSSNILAGLLIGHQFLLNRFIFSQELGFYVFKETEMYNEAYRDLFHTVYHRWGISYNIKRRWSVGITLLAHKQVADFIDGRVTYRLR